MKELYDAIEMLAKWLGADPATVSILLILPLAAFYFRFKYYQDVLKSPRGLGGVRERLATHGDWRSAYFGSLRRVLTWVDCKLGPSVWSADSYEFTLNMALIYPFASLSVVWVATGQNTSGISGLLPGSTPLWGRTLFLFAICASAFFFYRFLTSASGWQRLVNYVVAGAFFVAGAFAGAFVETLEAALALAIVVTYVVTVTIIVTMIPDMMVRRVLKKGFFYILFIPAMLGLLAAAISNPGWIRFKGGGDHSAYVFILLFLVLLPLTNSVFDWLSLVATRGLLKGMAARDDIPSPHVARNALLGLVLGLLLLAGLAVAATAGLQTVNLLSQSHGGPEFFDLAGMLHRLRVNPTEPAVWWVYFTLFSTMLPTVFHAAIASASFVTWRLPDSWRRHWLDLIGTGDIRDDHRVLVGMAWRLTLMDAATVLLAALSAAILFWLLFWLMPLEGGGLLWLCEWVAECLGAPIQI